MKKKIGFKILKILGIVLVTLIVLLGAAIGGFSLRDSIKYKDYYNVVTKEFEIPGLNKNFTPQGIAYSSSYDTFLNCGYNSKNKEAEIYVINNKDKSYKKVGLIFNDKVFTSHAGGIAISHNNVYLANASRIYVIPLDSVINAKENDRVDIIKSFYVPVTAAYVFANEDRLLVGEFIDEKNNYSTDESHQISVNNGVNKGLIVSYSMDKVLESEDNKPLEPDYGYSVCDKVQGCALTSSGRIVLSTSWGLNDSHLLIHNNIEQKTQKLVKLTKGKVEMSYSLDIYVLDDNNLEKDIVGPAMNEDLEYANGKIYINNESASNKYIFGKFTKAKNVYSYSID